jgi:hypothetical protein
VRPSLPQIVEESSVPAKLVVKKFRNGSRVTLVGPSGKELLTSSTFTEPRAKGATLRSLRTLLGAGITVEDHTVVAKVTRSKTPSASVGAIDDDKGLKVPVAAKPRARKTSAAKVPAAE